jgi:8-oxo-dGTP diphosphatase
MIAGSLVAWQVDRLVRVRWTVGETGTAMARLALDKVAWIRLDGAGRILTTRNRGRQLFYLPGGRREVGESDVQTLTREVAEELSVAVELESIRYFGTYELSEQDGGVSRMTCYFADYVGTLAIASEIDEMAWMHFADRDRASAPDQLVFDALHSTGHLV